MPLGTTKKNSPVSYVNGGASYPTSITHPWMDGIDIGGLISADAATITNPTTQITTATRKLIQKSQGLGTLLQLRTVYDATATGFTVTPIFAVFGRVQNSGDAWQRLKTRAGGTSVTTNAAATDVSNGTFKHTTPDSLEHTLDCMGCDEILIGVETVCTPNGGADANLSTLQVKFL